jgi:UDP-glucuronate decarboxylase
VQDLIAGLARLLSLDATPPGPINLGNPQELRVSDLVERVLALTGSASAVTWHPLPVDDPQRRRPDISAARRLLRWEPQVELDGGLKATIAWFKKEVLWNRTEVAASDDALSRHPAGQFGAVAGASSASFTD